MNAPLPDTGNAAAAARFIAGIHDRALPADVLAETKKCLIDWCGVAIGAHAEDAGRVVREVVGRWRSQGNSLVLFGPSAAPPAAALLNGTLAHCLDFDDTHVSSTAHLSAPTWSAVLAAGTNRGASEIELLSAFAAGFEVGGRLGGQEFGVAANKKGWHSTGVFGCLAAAAGASAALRLDVDAVTRALGAAATQTGGLTESFGTMAKPFHAGKAALNGVLSAELAQAGLETARTILDPERGLGAALMQADSPRMPRFDAGAEWELLRNTFKPYACCLLTHPTVDAARSLASRIAGRPVTRAYAHVNPMAIQLAGKTSARTPLEGKFSTAFVTALGLSGHAASQSDFVDARVADPAIQALADRVELVPSPELEKTAARVEVRLADGTVLEAVTPLAKGNPGNPMSGDDMRAKFMPLVEPVLGSRAAELFDVLSTFEQPGRLRAFASLVAAK